MTRYKVAFLPYTRSLLWLLHFSCSTLLKEFYDYQWIVLARTEPCNILNTQHRVKGYNAF